MITINTVVAVLIGVASAGAWFALYGLALLATRPSRPQPAPPTQDLPGTEPPAVVSLLTNHWEVTEDAAESTLIDLAARHFLEFRQPGNDPAHTTIHLHDADVSELNAYERAVYQRVAGLAVGNVLPLTALTFRDQAQAAGFAKRLRTAVIADARERGLSQRRFGKGIRSMLTGAALAAGAGVAVCVAMLARTRHDSGDALVSGGYGWVIAFAVLTTVANRRLGERDTPAGREAAARWLGVRTWLERTGTFGDLPPAAVAVWDRYLSYGDALGTTRTCAAVIDLGMGNRKQVWSSYGGVWHRVRVRYPTFWPRYGKPAGRLVLRGVLCGGVGFVLLYYWARGVAAALGSQVVGDGPAADFADPVRAGGLVVGGVLAAYGAYVLIRTVVDLAAPATVTGQVLWKQVWRSTSGGEDQPPKPWLHYLAVDDGGGDRTTAWGLPSERAGQAETGDTVTLTVRRWSRRVTQVTVDAPGTGRALAEADAAAARVESPDPDARSAGRGLAGLLLAPGAGLPDLLSGTEVSQALGIPVTVRSLPADASALVVRPAIFLGPGDRPVLHTMAAGGLPGRLAMRARHRGQPLPGVGDEAYAGDTWLAARRGDVVVVLSLTGDGRRVGARALYPLLVQAIDRLPASTPG
ncbi:DUF2207 family protein [Rugosimonospora africana]|uniref:Predicted membrane protein YciQ-like C-terminal domain-containing protein n=1 Tax=Rugosimonospora africana TaxID=556532 RepID=A0A8J3QQS6_9ACTN|nr:DUF2207 domain-containing protein [Rugosimonospora africana]GIH15735.1 hypothetical protein Raf01_39070 [Rugosimonospora africana]